MKITELFPDMKPYEFEYDENVEIVSKEIVDYYEGDLQTKFVFKHKPSGKFYEFIKSSNSWSEIDEEFDELTEVAPVQVMVTQYKKVS